MFVYEYENIFVLLTGHSIFWNISMKELVQKRCLMEN